MKLAVRATESESSGPSPNKHVVDQMIVNFVQIVLQLSWAEQCSHLFEEGFMLMHGFLGVKLVCICGGVEFQDY